MSNDTVFIDLHTRLRKYKEEFAMEFKERVEEKTPVRTGALQRGYGIQQRQTGFDLYNTQEHFEYIEYGTRHIEPRRMVGRTMLEIEEISQIAAERAGVKK